MSSFVKNSLSMSISSSDLDVLGSKPEGLERNLKCLDIFSGPRAEFKKGTVHGAVATLIMVLISLILLIVDLRYSLRIQTEDRLVISTTPSTYSKLHPLEFFFELHFYDIPCPALHISFRDGSNEILKVNGNITKIPANKEGIQFPDRKVELKIGPGFKKKGDSLPCGDCMGAGLHGQCCNSCWDIQKAYMKKGWKFNFEELPICQSTLAEVVHLKQNNSPGCHISGDVFLPKDKGRIQIESDDIIKQLENQNYTNFAETINFDHEIVSFRFGPKISSVASPLEQHSWNSSHRHGEFQYYLSVVPMNYEPLLKPSIPSYRYSTTQHFKSINHHVNLKKRERSKSNFDGGEGVSFYYTISPVSAHVKEYRMGWVSYISSVCAVIGGIYTFVGIMNSFIS
eukprot:441179_1